MRKILLYSLFIFQINIVLFAQNEIKPDFASDAFDICQIKNVSHGTINYVYYHSKNLNKWRPLVVYTPPTYDIHSDKKYPVLVLMHGGGGWEMNWIKDQRANCILDNMIASGTAEEMIIVMPYGYTGEQRERLSFDEEGLRPITDDILYSLIPFVDEHYHTFKDAEHRAIAGLSMGGGISFYIGLGHPEIFGSVGSFSSGIFGGKADENNFDPNRAIPGLYTRKQKYNESFHVLYMSCGTEDPRIKPTEVVLKKMRNNGINVIFNSFPGGHEGKVWIRSIHEFMKLLFK